jgi:hypothetical protein
MGRMHDRYPTSFFIRPNFLPNSSLFHISVSIFLGGVIKVRLSVRNIHNCHLPTDRISFDSLWERGSGKHGNAKENKIKKEREHRMGKWRIHQAAYIRTRAPSCHWFDALSHVRVRVCIC